jgi:arylsulfatase A-like enzyme
LAGCDAPERPIPPVPNVILISLDTLRADHLGVYGYERPTSPEIDAFAGESFVFERALAPAPNTPPSQMTMMTSLTPGRHGFTGSWDTLAPDIETLAQRLSQAGLATAGFVDAGYLRAIFGFDRGFDTYDDRGGGLASIIPRALRWLDAHPDQRFFLFVHTYDIHAPYVSPAPYAGMFHETPYTGSLDPTAEALDAIWRESIEISAADLQHLVDSYDEGIRYTDAQLGQFLTALRERGRLDDTLIIITSDHGEEFGEHGSVSHWRLYFQPNLRIPLIIRLPGGGRVPERLTQPTQLLDVLPTILDAAGAPRLEAAQGRSLMPLITARTAGPERPADAVRAILGWWPEPLTQPRRSIILGDSQLIFDSAMPGKEELYDLAADPMTRNNLAADRPDEVARLLARARADLARNRPLPGTGEATQIELERRVLEQLEALGYRPVRTEAGAPAATPE